MFRIISLSLIFVTLCLAGMAQCEPQSITTGSPCSQQTPATSFSFCADNSATGVTYFSTTDGPNASPFTGSSRAGCCLTTPNPAWFFFQVDDPGTLTIRIEQHSAAGSGLDVDFVCWGPFSATNQNDFSNKLCCGQFNISDENIVDCSYSTASMEDCNFGNVQSGQWYLLLITNYSNQPGIINFNATINSTATTNCDLLNIVESNSPICEGDTLVLHVSTPQLGATYHWTGPGNFSLSTTDTILSVPNATANMSGEYHMTMTGIAQNSNEAVTEVTIYPSPTPNITANHPSVCIGGSVQLFASGDHPTYLYSWSGRTLQNGIYSVIANNQSSIVAYPEEASRYVLTAKDSENECMGKDSIDIIVNPLPDVEISVDDSTLCLGQSTTITATGGTYYVWSNGSTSSTIEVSPTQTTSYTVEVLSDSLCSKNASTEIVVFPGAPQSTSNGSPCSLQTPATPFCSDANPYGVTYPSNTNSPNSSPFTGSNQVNCCVTTPNPAWYYFQIRDAGTLTIHIEQHNASGSGLDVDFVCWGPFSANNQTDFTSNLCCGQYNINDQTVVDCSYSADAVEDCHFGYVQSGQWYLLLLTNYSNQAGTINFNSTANSTATTNCDLLNSGDSNSPVCEGGTVELYVTAPVQGATYNWTGPNGFTLSTTSPILRIPNATANMSGEYHMTMTGISQNSNEAVVEVTIFPSPTPEIIANHESICIGDTVHLSAAGYHPDYTYKWSAKPLPDGNFSVFASYTSEVQTIPSQSTLYVLIAEANECIGLDSLLVTVYPNPEIKIAIDDTSLCYGRSATITAYGGSHYHWSTGSTNSTIRVSPEQTTSYSVEVQTEALCKGDTTVKIIVYPEISLSYEVLPSYCGHPSGEIIMNAVGGTGNFMFSSKQAVFTDNTASGLLDGIYTITTSDSVGCDIISTITIPSEPGPIPCFFFASSDDVYMSITNCTQGNNSYYWDFGDGVTSTETHPVHEYMEPGRYNVSMVVIDEHNCTDSMNRDYVINGPVYIANAFTPNGDGINDEICIIGKTIQDKEFLWAIFDRHGSLVFISENPSICWDGTLFDGQNAISGMYVYHLKYKDVNGNYFERDGTITLIR